MFTLFTITTEGFTFSIIRNNGCPTNARIFIDSEEEVDALVAQALAELKELGEVESDTANYVPRIIAMLESGIAWDSHADGSCPCSPSFVANNQILSNLRLRIQAN